jgi:uncharacterized protein YbaP (TraB family)
MAQRDCFAQSAVIPTVIAVGALHLAGADGLIGQLAAVGIPTDRVEG